MRSRIRRREWMELRFVAATGFDLELLRAKCTRLLRRRSVMANHGESSSCVKLRYIDAGCNPQVYIYSCLNDVAGSTRAARQAGRRQASSATVVRMAQAVM